MVATPATERLAAAQKDRGILSLKYEKKVIRNVVERNAEVRKEAVHAPAR